MDFLFSVIIPVYMAEDYIEDAIESVLHQSIGFKDNIELILVNDGSPDESGDICSLYAAIHPKNIIYLYGENEGVSAARNKGLKVAHGKFINFLDADDKWDEDALEKAYQFFKEHPEIDVVACMMEYFEGKTGIDHPLNFKFNKNRVINTMKSPADIQMHAASCFIRRNAVNTVFKEGLKYAEDSLFITSIIMQKKLYGVLSDVHYFYRKRMNETSAIDGSKYDKAYYCNAVDMFHLSLVDAYKEPSHPLPAYVQNILMYDIQWRLKKGIPSDVLEKDEADTYRNKICSVLKYIDDNIIMKQKNIYKEHKILALSMKYGEDTVRHMEQVDNGIYYHGTGICQTENMVQIKLAYIEIKKGVLMLEGLINTPFHPNDYTVNAMDENGTIYKIGSLIDFKRKEKICLYGHYYYEKQFKMYIYMQEKERAEITFYVSYKKGNKIPVIPVFLNICMLNTSTNRGYLKTGGWTVHADDEKLIFDNTNIHPKVFTELKFQLSLAKIKKWKPILYRIASNILKKAFRKDIWIISDRENEAGDNGECFFKYVSNHKPKGVCPIFAISKSSSDYKKMKPFGKVVNSDSIWYKLLFLCADKVISSQANESTINPFGSYRKYLKDMYQFDFVFLQHGITKDDLSGWLNRMDKNINMFVTSSVREYNSIIYGNYGYDESIVKLTGLARYDRYNDKEPEKLIVIMPTWRKYINGCFSGNMPVYCKDFKQSKFFKFYDSLIRSETLRSKMKELGYKGILCMHPMFKPQEEHFKGNDVFTISDMPYGEAFKKGSMLVTDYSSVFFDFGYMKKPIVYAQFDEDTFYEEHSYDKGYFDYQRDGFGKVCRKVNECVDEIIRILENNCIQDKVYQKREEDFYYVNKNSSNCRKIMDCIKSM